MDNTSVAVIAVAAVAVLVLIIVFMAADSGSTNVYMRYPGHSYRGGPYYQHGGRSHRYHHGHGHGRLY